MNDMVTGSVKLTKALDEIQKDIPGRDVRWNKKWYCTFFRYCSSFVLVIESTPAGDDDISNAIAVYNEITNEENAEAAWSAEIPSTSVGDDTSDEEYVDDYYEEDNADEVIVIEGEGNVAVRVEMPLKEGKILRLKKFCITRWFSSWLVMERLCSLYRPLLELLSMVERGVIALSKEKTMLFTKAMNAIDETTLTCACCFLYPLVQGINYCQRDSTLQMDILPMMESIHSFYMKHTYSTEVNPTDVILPIARELIIDAFKERECLFYEVPKEVRAFFFDQFFADHPDATDETREYQEAIRESCNNLMHFVLNCSRVPAELRELFRSHKGEVFNEVRLFMSEHEFHSSLSGYMASSSQVLPHLHALYEFLFIQPASSASVERSFSIQNQIQTGSRNQLGCKTIRNLLFIKMNYSIAKKCGWKNDMLSFLHAKQDGK